MGLIVTPALSPSLLPAWLPDRGVGACELAARAVPAGDDIEYGAGPRPGIKRSYAPGSLNIGWETDHGRVGMDRTRLSDRVGMAEEQVSFGEMVTRCLSLA